MSDSAAPRASLLLAFFATIGASICCVGPLLLVMLGIGGTWVSQLTALEPLRPWFMGLTLVFLGLAFRKLYLRPLQCEPGKLCADPRVLKRQRLIFWLVTLVLAVVMAFPLYASLFY